jgi:N4-(beta-N-acetylglucosaminyl)-L-asparaginase
MSKRLNRRELIIAGAGAGLAATRPGTLFGQAPAVLAPHVKPVVISSANGNHYKNGGDMTAVQKAFSLIVQGADVLDAVIAGVNIPELDPEDDSVGYGGLPNADGVVQLDACCMHGPLRRAGGVAALEGVRTPSLVAKAVLEQTDHHLLVGKGAQDFARGLGWKIEDDLNTEKSRRLWLEWKRRVDPEHWLDPRRRAAAGLAAALQMAREVGAAGSTGRGEANLYNLSSFWIVEALGRGMHPKDAGFEALRRVAANTVEKRLRNARNEPAFDLNFYVLNRRGEFAGVSMHPARYAVCTENGPETRPTEALYEGPASS